MIKPKKPTHQYVDNKKLYGEMIHYLNALNAAKTEGVPKNELPRVPEYVGKSIYLIATRLSTRPNFIGYSFREEMIGDGIENCLMYLHNFNPDKSNNPFAYFTQIIYFAFVRRIQKEQKQQYIKHKSMQNAAIMNELVDMSPDDQSHFNAAYLQNNSDKSNDLIERFESSVKAKRKKLQRGVEKFIGEEDEQT
jgi:hypothetical protein